MYLVYLLKEKRTDTVIYVGSSARPAERMKEHLQALRDNKKGAHHLPLYRYMRENGLKFYKDVEVIWVDVAEDRDSMLALETHYYYKYESTLLNDRPAENKNGEFNPKRRAVKCLTDGMEFPSVLQCATYYGIPRTTLSRTLHGYKKNTTGKRFLFNGKEV